uniref:ATP synthase complex subunit 8 n=1 Tax=Elateroidea sp. 1 KM-2017 TaxID=2219423 RepID=A0A346RJW4_9COLE|nr:ATP synthase F0 subunit 8 [Elateroidea sp. 1 KM-2017]
MPQMAPLSWISLFMTTIVIFLVINSLNYYMYKHNPTKSETKKLQNKNWKW